jgi:formate hydrogenlyase subunit 3/multisubunit Na+/H+ antiporter MnhD subunit
MRNLFVLLALLGLAGIVLGALAIVHGAAGPHGIPFRFENYGGPGSIIAGLIMLAASLYLRAAWPDRR